MSGLKYAAMLAFPVLLARDRENTSESNEVEIEKQIQSKKIRVLIPDMEKIYNFAAMEDTPRVMPLFELSYDKSVRSRSLMTRTFCSSEPQSLINLNCEPQSIVEFYCDDDINHQTQWGFLDNDQEKYFLDDKEEKSGDFKYSDNIFLSMSGCESF